MWDPQTSQLSSLKYSPVTQNFHTYDWEPLVIVDKMKPWRQYVEVADHQILIKCDHKNLKYFQTSKVLSRRQPWWAEVLSTYNFTIQHLEGTKNLADRPSRQPNQKIGYEKQLGHLLVTLAATVEAYNDLKSAIKTAQATDSLGVDVKCRLVNIPMISGPEGSCDSGWDWDPERVIPEALIHQGRIHVPQEYSIRSKVISLLHYNLESGHLELSRVRNWHLVISIGQPWMLQFQHISRDVRYVIGSRHHTTHIMGSTCHLYQHHGPGRDSQCISSLTDWNQWLLSMPES